MAACPEATAPDIQQGYNWFETMIDKKVELSLTMSPPLTAHPFAMYTSADLIIGQSLPFIIGLHSSLSLTHLFDYCGAAS